MGGEAPSQNLTDAVALTENYLMALRPKAEKPNQSSAPQGLMQYQFCNLTEGILGNWGTQLQ